VSGVRIPCGAKFLDQLDKQRPLKPFQLQQRTNNQQIWIVDHVYLAEVKPVALCKHQLDKSAHVAVCGLLQTATSTAGKLGDIQAN
jgi:hypothetical protein